MAGYGPCGKLVVPQTFMDHVYASRALDYLLSILMCLFWVEDVPLFSAHIYCGNRSEKY